MKNKRYKQSLQMNMYEFLFENICEFSGTTADEFVSK